MMAKAAMEMFNLRVEAATVKEAADGSIACLATIKGSAVGVMDLVESVGQEVDVRSQRPALNLGILRSLSLKAGKDGRIGATLKVAGSAALQDAVGTSVRVDARQLTLPGGGAPGHERT